MDEARRVLDRLDRIEALHRGDASPLLILGELQQLLAEAEAWGRAEGARADRAQIAVRRVRDALERGRPSAGPQPSHSGAPPRREEATV